MYHIPWSKTTGADGADIVLTKINAFNDPVTALRHHLSANATVPDHAPLFAYETADGGWAPMTKPWFMARCTEIWDSVGILDKVLGHGFRIGGATELLLMGTPPDIVAIQGRWKSRAFLKYWRKIELILPIFISRSHFASRFSSVQASMSVFRKKYL